MQCRLHELRHKRRISVAAASKILANLVYSYKGMGLSMGTMCAGVTPTEGPALYYIDSDGTRLAGNLFCVGSGQTFAYGVLDAEYKYEMGDEEALELGKRSILAATHRDAFSGGYINLYHVKEEGWVKHGFMDTNPIFWRTVRSILLLRNVTCADFILEAGEGRVLKRAVKAGVADSLTKLCLRPCKHSGNIDVSRLAIRLSCIAVVFDGIVILELRCIADGPNKASRNSLPTVRASSHIRRYPSNAITKL